VGGGQWRCYGGIGDVGTKPVDSRIVENRGDCLERLRAKPDEPCLGDMCIHAELESLEVTGEFAEIESVFGTMRFGHDCVPSPPSAPAEPGRPPRSCPDVNLRRTADMFDLTVSGLIPSRRATSTGARPSAIRPMIMH
jgi:hypothetical protein